LISPVFKKTGEKNTTRMAQDPKPRVLETRSGRSQRLGELDVYLINVGTVDTIAYHGMEREWLFHNFRLGNGRCFKLTHNRFAYKREGGFSIHLLNEVIPKGSETNPFGVIPAALILDQFFPGLILTISPSTKRRVIQKEKLTVFEGTKQVWELPSEKGEPVFLSDDLLAVRYLSTSFWRLPRDSEESVLMMEVNASGLLQLSEEYTIFHAKDTGICILDIKSVRVVVLEKSRNLNEVEVFWLDNTRFLVYGKNENVERSWVLNINDVKEHFLSAVPLKKQLIRDNLPLASFAVTEDLKRAGNIFPFANQVGRAHRFKTLERHKPELRKEARDFLIENVLTVPAAVLEIVTKFIV
jgi:hypothetical protein